MDWIEPGYTAIKSKKLNDSVDLVRTKLHKENFLQLREKAF
jgi:hypothetical protein